ncbi:hypothetical protein J6590_081844 [Homalodisca vitripennis]|nr:hypothetical protein J6590_081844 [Homalodisca vitripennis]
MSSFTFSICERCEHVPDAVRETRSLITDHTETKPPYTRDPTACGLCNLLDCFTDIVDIFQGNTLVHLLD